MHYCGSINVCEGITLWAGSMQSTPSQVNFLAIWVLALTFCQSEGMSFINWLNDRGALSSSRLYLPHLSLKVHSFFFAVVKVTVLNWLLFTNWTYYTSRGKYCFCEDDEACFRMWEHVLRFVYRKLRCILRAVYYESFSVEEGRSLHRGHTITSGHVRSGIAVAGEGPPGRARFVRAGETNFFFKALSRRAIKSSDLWYRAQWLLDRGKVICSEIAEPGLK